MVQKPFDHEGTQNLKEKKSTKRAYKIFLCALCIFVLGALSGAPPTARAQPANILAADSPPGGYVPNEVLLKVSGSAPSALRKNLGKLGKASDSGLALGDGSLLVLKVPAGTVEKTIADLQKQPGVVYAEPDYYVYAQEVIPNDPAWPSQYGPRHIHAPAAWEISKGASGVTIAILDSGVDFHQPDLAPKLVAGFDFVNLDDDPQDDFGHGTQVAGVAAAVTDNKKGIAGISWGARIMPVKVLNSYGSGSILNVAAGIRFAANSGARVINLSLGGAFPPPIDPPKTLCDAVAYAANLGVVVVAAAGNGYGAGVYYPGACPEALAISATDQTDQVADFSSQGPEVALAAPGVDIISDGWLANGEPLVTESGTSFSAPFVSGAAAILLGIPGNRYSSDVIRQLETTAKDLGPGGRDDFYGYGLLQLDAALKLAVREHPLPPAQKKKAENEPSATPGLSGGFGGGAASLTPTPTMTATATATSTSTATPTPTSTATPTETSTPGGALAAKPTRHPQAGLPMPPMPVVAGFFLLAGMALIGYALALRRSV